MIISSSLYNKAVFSLLPGLDFHAHLCILPGAENCFQLFFIISGGRNNIYVIIKTHTNVHWLRAGFLDLGCFRS